MTTSKLSLGQIEHVYYTTFFFSLPEMENERNTTGETCAAKSGVNPGFSLAGGGGGQKIMCALIYN